MVSVNYEASKQALLASRVLSDGSDNSFEDRQNYTKFKCAEFCPHYLFLLGLKNLVGSPRSLYSRRPEDTITDRHSKGFIAFAR